MKRRLTLSLLLSLALGWPVVLVAQDVFPDVEYIAGKDGFADKAKGSLVLGTAELRFLNKDGNPVFAIPLANITDVSQDTQIRDASVGKKLLFGGLAGSRKQEFVQVTTETPEAAEGIVFKVKQGTGVSVVAKLKFAVKKAKGGAAPEAPAADSSH